MSQVVKHSRVRPEDTTYCSDGKRLYWQAVAAAVIGFGAGCESKKFRISPLM